MQIQTVTDSSHRAPAMPVPPAATTAGATAAAQQPLPEAPVTAPPAITVLQDVEVGVDEATNRKVYDILVLDSGYSIHQIPAVAVLGLVANILRQLEAEGLR